MELTPGKRYRMTTEGVADEDGFFKPDGFPFLIRDAMYHPKMTFELLPDPLPTTPGSVVRTDHDKTFVRLETEDHLWPWLNVAVEDDFVANDYFKGGATVLFDAGAER